MQDKKVSLGSVASGDQNMIKLKGLNKNVLRSTCANTIKGGLLVSDSSLPALSSQIGSKEHFKTLLSQKKTDSQSNSKQDIGLSSRGPGGAGALKRIKLMQSSKNVLNSSQANNEKRRLSESKPSHSTSTTRARSGDGLGTSLHKNMRNLDPRNELGENLSLSFHTSSLPQHIEGNENSSDQNTTLGSNDSMQDCPSSLPHTQDSAGQSSLGQTVPSSRSIGTKKGRGVARGYKLDVEVKKHGKYKIVFALGELVPTENESEFSTGIGIIIRVNADIQGVNHWKEVSDENKEVCYARLFQWFDVEGWPTDQRVEKILDNKFQTAYTRWRSTLNKTYQKLTEDGTDPRQVCPRKDITMEKWQVACDFIENDEFQKRSHINAQNRSKMPYNHTSGKTSILSRYRKMEEKSQIKLWEDVHRSKKRGGQFVNETAQSLHEEMIVMKSQPLIGEGQSRSEEAILESTLGHKSGYVKGMGHGFEVVCGKKSYSYMAANNEFKEKLSELENAKNKIVDLTEAYEEQNSILDNQKMALDEQKQEMVICKEQNKAYAHQLEALQLQMTKMQQMLQQISSLHPNMFSNFSREEDSNSH